MNKHYLQFLILCGIAFLLSVLPFLQTAGYGFVNLDDHAYVGANSFVAGGFSFEGLHKAFTDFSQAIWMPLTWISYMLDVELARACGVTESAVMHIHSVLIHGVNAVLLFVLLTRLLRGAPVWACAVAALVWAVHPLRCESVCWVASRKDVLSMCGLLVALIFWVRFRTAGNRSVSLGWYGASLGCFLVGALAKPSVMTFGFIVFLFDWLVLHVVDPFELWRRRAEKGAGDRVVRALWMYALPFAGFVALGAFSGHVQAAGDATSELAGVSLLGRLLNAAAAFGIYVWHTVCPTGLSYQCLNRWPAMPRFLVPGILISAGVGAYLIWAFRGLLSGAWKKTELRDGVLASVLLFCITIGPFLGLANFGYHAFADRFTYIPSLGVALVMSMLLARLRTKVAAMCGVVAVVALGAGAFHQTRYWKDDGVLNLHVLEVDGEDNSMAHLNLGEYYFEFPHDLEKANAHFARTYELHPNRYGKVAPLHLFSLCEAGKLDEAGKMLRWYIEWQDKNLFEKSGDGGGTGQHKAHQLYRLARACWFAAQPNMLADAERELSDMEPEYGDTSNYLYVNGRVAWIKGDKEGARALWKRAREDAKTDNYIRYSFTSRQ